MCFFFPGFLEASVFEFVSCVTWVCCFLCAQVYEKHLEFASCIYDCYRTSIIDLRGLDRMCGRPKILAAVEPVPMNPGF
jgi:hypothetical protein